MRVFAVVPALSVVLAAASSFAQTPPAPRPPGQTSPAAPQPAAPQPAAPQPAATQPAAPKPAPPQEPFKDGMKYGYINVQDIASGSADGKAAAQKLTALRDKLQKDLQAKEAAMIAAEKKLAAEGALRSDGGAALQADIERQKRDLTRMAQDADEDIDKLTNQLQAEFMTKLRPAIDRVAREKQVDLIFNLQESGLVWAIPGTNLTNDVIRALDTAKPPAAAAPAATAPATGTPAAAPADKPATGAPAPATPAR